MGTFCWVGMVEGVLGVVDRLNVGVDGVDCRVGVGLMVDQSSV